MKQFPSKAFGVFFLLFCISFLFLHCHSLHHPLHHECSAETFDPNSTFQNNLGQLVNSLTNFGPVKGLLKIRVGEFPEKVYGLFQCRGDVTTESCSDCFQTSIDYIQGSCVSNLSITGIVWYEICLLRYSDEDFYGVADTHGFLMYNSLNVSEPESGSIDEDALITSLVARATSTSSKFLATDMPVASETRYGLVQCTGDLTIYNCSRCWYALMYKLKNCCYGKKSWRYLALSCSIWYDSEKFYGVPGSLELAPQQMPIAPRSSNTGQLVSLLAPAPKSTPTNISQGKTGSSRKAGHKLLWQVGVGVLVVIVLILVLVWCCISRWRKPQGVAGISGGDGENKVKTQELQLVDIATLRAATDNFSNANKLGEGGFGAVYKGRLISGKEIAVKRLNSTKRRTKEFESEAQSLAKFQHKNLVRLYSGCMEEDKKYLVYEYMPNKSLDHFIFTESGRTLLDWGKRLTIIRGIARGLLYLHEDSRENWIHMDLKAPNILLDTEMNAKIADFGTAKVCRANESEASTSTLIGTWGYMAPEYIIRGEYSVKSDVFSFGVLLLEIISGKQNCRSHLLLADAWNLWSAEKIKEFIDPLLLESCLMNEALRCIHVGLLCIQENSKDRPLMAKVVLMLESESATREKPNRPPVTMVTTVDHESSHPPKNVETFSINEVTISDFVPR